MGLWKKIKVFVRTKLAKSSYELHGVTIPIDRKIITDRILYSIIRGRYEGTEARAVKSMVKPQDRVLELGAGIGLISVVASKIVGENSVVCVEANPKMVGYIQKVHAANRVNPKIVNAVAVGKSSTDTISFYLRENFWVSSMSPTPEDYLDVVQVQTASIDDLVREYKPSVVIIDIEGGEVDLMSGQWADQVRLVIMELHPDVTGEKSTDQMIAFFRSHGFTVRVDEIMLFAERETGTV
jgi:FkbM family methyltransferase